MNFLINNSCYNKKYKNIIVEILGSSKGIFNSFFYVIYAFYLLSRAIKKTMMNKHVYYHTVIKKKFVV